MPPFCHFYRKIYIVGEGQCPSRNVTLIVQKQERQNP